MAMKVSEALSLAYEYHRSGRISEAQQLYWQILQLEPDHPVPTHLLGLIALQHGNPDEAFQLYRRAIALNPRYVDVHVDMAGLLRQQGSVDQAIEVYRHALMLDPGCTIAHHNLGDTLTERGDLDAARACFERALELSPDLAEAYSSLGNILKLQGKPEEAIDYYRRAIALKPHYAPAHNNLGVVLSELGEKVQAVTCFKRGIELAPGDADAYNNLGRTFNDLGKHEEAITFCSRATELKPKFYQAYGNLGKAFSEQGRYQQAASCFRSQIQIQPENPESYLSLGNALMELDQTAEARAFYERVLKLKSDSPEALSNLGMTYQVDHQYEKAIEYYRRSIEVKPDYVDAHYNLADALLTLGDFLNGFKEYEYRWLRKGVKKHSYSQTQWAGESLAGKTILLVCEQGLGDTLQFIRFAAMVKQKGARVVLSCVKPLVKLLSNMPGVDLVVPEGDPLPPFDVYAPLMSLPGLLDVKVEDIPNVLPVPYLFAKQALVEYWSQRLGPRKPGELRVGIAWQGNPKHVRDRYRSVPLRHFTPLLSVPGIRLVSLQKHFGVEQIAPLSDQLPLTSFVEDPARDPDSFEDSAALFSLMDAVVTIDSAPAHLAGALGVPLWVLCPVHGEWRWLTDRQDSPWYPSARIVRPANRSDWPRVIAEIARELAMLPRQLAGTHVIPAITVPKALEMAHQFLQNGDQSQAKEICQQVLNAYPDEPSALHLLGNVLFTSGDVQEAIQCYGKALQLEPMRVGAYCDLGIALNALGRQEEASLAFENAIQINPGFTNSYQHMGDTLSALGRDEQAISCCTQAIERYPNESSLHSGLGNIFKKMGRRDEAILQYHSAIRLNPRDGVTLNNLGVALNEIGNVVDAVDCFQRAIAIHSDTPEYHHNLGHALLSLGDYPNGFREFEYRWQLANAQRPQNGQPIWTGEPIAGKRLLLLCEHGLGDCIQFIRFARRLKSLGATVFFGCFKPLAKLLGQVPGIDLLILEGDPIPPWDYSVPLLSLPSILKTTLEEIPDLLPVPYLKPQPELVDYWRARLGSKQSGEVRVGLVWQGNPAHGGDKYRSIPLSGFIPLASVPGVRLYSFQKNFGTEQIEPLADLLPLTCLTSEPDHDVDSFLDTAALMSLMDLVISVDSAPVHLAGALGIRTWVLCSINPDWRWLTEREDSPWYPSVRVMRQSKPHQWGDVIQRVVEDLETFSRESVTQSRLI